MPTNLQSPEPPIMAKELVDYFAGQQIKIHYAYARALIAACPNSLHGRYVRGGEAWTWWVLHPEFKPFGVKPPVMVHGNLSEIGPKSAFPRDLS